MVHFTGPGFDPYMKAAGGAVSHPIPLGGCRSWDCRFGTSQAEAWGNRCRVYPALQRGQEPMLFDPYHGKRGGRVVILGIGKADKRHGFPIGVQFFGALGSEADII